MLSTIFELLLQILFGFVGYLTAKVLLPAISFGVLRVDSLDAGHAPFRWHGFKRIQNGRIIVEANTASFIGVIFWIAAFVAVVALWM